MATQATIQGKIYKGYGLAALRLGASYNFFRPPVPSSILMEDGEKVIAGDGGSLQADPSSSIIAGDGGRALAEDGEGLSSDTANLIADDGERLTTEDGMGVLTGENATSPPAYGTYPVGGSSYSTLLVSFNAEDMGYKRPNKYAKPTWYAVFDGSNAAVGDYLVGPQGTFFIAAMQPLLPILVVECNRVIDVSCTAPDTTVGQAAYGGRTAATDTIIMQQWPASILQGTKGEKDEVNLPGDTRTPWFAVLLPFYPGVILKTSYRITDDLGRTYTISSVELSDLGYRLTCQQATV